MRSLNYPSPAGLELLSDLRKLQESPLELIIQSTKKYGDFVHYRLGVLDAYLINHPDYIQHVLQANNRNYTKDTFQYNLLSSITGDGLLTSDGDLWLTQRRLIQPAFHRRHIASWGKIITDATESMLNRWEETATTRTEINLEDEMMRLTLEVVGKVLFSIDFSREAGNLSRAVLTTLDYIIEQARNPIRFPLWVPTAPNRRFYSALEQLDRAVFELIRDHRRHPYRSNRGESQQPEDVLSLLLQAQDEYTNLGMEDRQLRDEVITLIIAGHETVASALTWTWYLLSQNPEFESQLYMEVFQNLGGKTPEVDDLSQLPYTRMGFQEALRLFPPAWMITRRAKADDQIGYDPELKIKQSGLVVISPYAVHRHPEFWQDPEAFKPDRFIEESGAKEKYAYIPFGAGPRLCIGETFALIEAQLILATIAQRYRFRLPRGHTIEVEPLVTLRPKNGLWMTLEDVR